MSDNSTVPTAEELGKAMEGSPGGQARGAAATSQPQLAPSERDRTSVELGDPAAAEFWSDRFNVTRAQLEEAVSAVGSDVHAVATYLRGQGSGD